MPHSKHLMGRSDMTIADLKTVRLRDILWRGGHGSTSGLDPSTDDILTWVLVCSKIGKEPIYKHNLSIPKTEDSAVSRPASKEETLAGSASREEEDEMGEGSNVEMEGDQFSYYLISLQSENP